MNIDRWFDLMSTLGFSKNPQMFERLLAAHREKHRRYHNEVHIDAVLAILDGKRELADQPSSVELALWFHDSIYKIFSSSNEEDSALWAQEFVLSESDNDELARTIYSLIMATQHNVVPEDNDQKLIVDVDLSILGAAETEYEKFELAIRDEYRLIPGVLYRKKRIEILNGFLERDFIFSLDVFREEFEERARGNLVRAIDSLQS